MEDGEGDRVASDRREKHLGKERRELVLWSVIGMSHYEYSNKCLL